MSTNPLRFGVWAPVHGPRAAHQDTEEPYDASWERNKALVLQAEAVGYDSTLIAQHTINPHQEDLDQLETWSSAAALAALTSRIEIIAAIKPYLFHPVVLAKMALQIENISRGRFALNLVNAWNKPELEKAGIGFAEHDDRYAYGKEWISIVAQLTSGERLTHKGENFDTPLRFGLSAFVITRETDAEAEQAHQRLLALAAQDAPMKAIQRANTDPKVVMMQTMQKSPRVGTNGGTAAGLVGSYDTVAARIREFHAAGIELFMLQFQPLESEMQRFAEQVFPRVRGKAALLKTSRG
ncbi:LLM class flavin-dependent oxidoreductase [Tardiphaga sp. 172_B4_N1_3]|uniref:LLM class flavin-dependent oxidoreductase n=1 Tax=Tardiphaga sp. 172_B4_N1_3 TaxID=3240787 RepID=UPI003F8C07C0